MVTESGYRWRKKSFGFESILGPLVGLNWRTGDRTV